LEQAITMTVHAVTVWLSDGKHYSSLENGRIIDKL